MLRRLAGLALVLGSACGLSQMAAPQGGAMTAASESLVIGAGDLLHITIFREDNLEQRVRVKDSGEVALSLVGNVAVQGLPAADAAQKIAARYHAGGFLNHPEVAVFVEESVSQRAAVLGEVEHPGLVPLTSSRSLLDVLSQAGGLTSVADRHITIRHAGEAPKTVFVSNRAEKALVEDVAVRPGDTILVPKAGIVYVLGDVGRPGGFVMQDDAQLSLLEAITLAAGANKTAAENHARLLRKVNGRVTEQPLALKAIERGQRADPQLEADDIVFIPFSMVKNVALGATSILASASSAAIYAVH
ncbi:MAG TPA: polysaccharide biosynthesis/export family protein [Acidobacteriaceae bacterium]